MPLQFADRVRVLTNTVGTGVLTLGASLPGLQGFSGVIATGNTVQYAIEDGFQWEIGIGTFTDNPPLLDRSSVQYSSDGAGVAIALSGSAQVFVTPNAQWFNQLNSLNIGLLPGGVLSGALTVQVPNVAIGAYDPDPGHANALGLQPSGGLYFTNDGVFVLGGLFADGTPNPGQQYLTYDQGGAVTLATGSITSGNGNTAGVWVTSGDASAGAGNSGYLSLNTGATTNGDSGSVALQSGSAASAGKSGAAYLATGDNTGTGPTGAIYLSSGSSLFGGATTGIVTLNTGATSVGGTSGSMTVGSGNAVDGVSGSVSVQSGVASGTGNSGTTLLGTGTVQTGTSGQTWIITGDSTANTGDIEVQSGQSASGNSGNIQLQSGGGNATGSISIGTTNAANGSSGILLLSTGSGTTGSGQILMQTGAATTGPASGIIVNTGGGRGGGGPISITTGNANTSGNGGDFSVTLGTGVARAGQFNVKASGTGNNLTITPGATTAGNVLLATSGLGGINLPGTLVVGNTTSGNYLTFGGGSTSLNYGDPHRLKYVRRTANSQCLQPQARLPRHHARRQARDLWFESRQRSARQSADGTRGLRSPNGQHHMNDMTQPEGRPLTVTLTVAQWDLVLRAMHEVSMPYRVSGPLIAQMLHQLNAVQVPTQTMNDADHHPEP